MMALLDPAVDFRGLTPGQPWQARTPRDLVEQAFSHWFELSDDIHEVLDISSGQIVDRQRLVYRFRVRNPDGDYVCEQTAYYDADADKITKLTRRRHRLIGLTGTAAMAASAALVVGLTGITGSATAHSTGTIRTPAFTLTRYANGTATLTINSNGLLDAAALQNDLQQYGIRAIVTSDSFCSSDPAPTGLSRVVSRYPHWPGQHDGTIPPGMQPTVTFNPSAMPAGTELSFGVFRPSSDGQQADYTLIYTNSYICTSTAPPPPHPGIMQFQVGGSGPGGA